MYRWDTKKPKETVATVKIFLWLLIDIGLATAVWLVWKYELIMLDRYFWK